MDKEQPKKKCVFKKFSRPGGANRRRRADTPSDKSSSDSDSDSNTAVFKREKKVKGGLTQASNTFKKRAKVASSSDDSDEDAAGSNRLGVAFKGTGTEKAGPSDGGATAVNEMDTELDRDARAVFERAQKVNEERKEKDEAAFNDKVYKGINNYAKYIEKKDSAGGSAAKMSTGPQRAPAHIRSTVRWDYAPDICKDYKETGFCGFGDSCKFMHDRSDYKFGWQLEREMASGTYGDDDEDDDKYKISSDDDDDLPFKCFICKDTFKNPVVTKCKHYFCEKCALDHYRKSQRCNACGAQTGGVFNPANEIIKKLEKLKDEEEEEKNVENLGSDNSDKDEDDD